MSGTPPRRAARAGSIAGIGLAGAPAAAATVTPTPGRPDTETPRHPDTETSQGRREPVARFTVRLYELDEVDAWEDLRASLRRELRRPVDKAEIVRALVTAASEDPAIRAALAARLRTAETTA